MVDEEPGSKAHEKAPSQGLSLTVMGKWEGVARAIVREGLDPHGINIPERNIREWIKALGKLYELKEEQ